MFPRRLRPVLLLVALLAACSDDGDGNGGNGAGGELDGTEVEVVAAWTGIDEERFGAVLDAFEERTGAKVRYTPGGDDIGGVLATRLDGDDPPDVAVLPRPVFFNDLARRGAVLPLPPGAADLVGRHYDKLWQDLAVVAGRPSGVWFKTTNKSLLWFNRSVLDKAGVGPPATWEELQAAAEAVNDDGVAPFSVPGAEGSALTDWFENVYLRTAGSDPFFDLTRHLLAWDDPTVTQALDTLGDVFRPDWLAGGPQGSLQTTLPEAVGAVYADPPEAAFVLAAGLTEPPRTDDTDFVDFPSIGGSPRSVVAGGEVAALLDDTPGGRALIEFLATPEAAAVWARLGGFVSANKGLDPSEYAHDSDRRAAEALVGAEVVRFDMSDLQPAAFGGTAGQGLWRAFQEYLSAPASGGEIAVAMEDAARDTFDP